MTNEKENKKKQDKVIKDVPKSGNDVYRVSVWTGKDGISFLDLRVLFKKDGRLNKTKEGMNILASHRMEVAEALEAAKSAKELPVPADGKKFESRLIQTVPISDTAEYQVSKVRGPKNSSVRLNYAFKGEEGEFIPSTKKAVSILEASVDGVVEALKSSEIEAVEAETKAA